MKILFLPGSYTSPAARFRLWQFVGPLASLGHAVTVKVIRPHREWTSSIRNNSLRSIHSKVGSLWRLVSSLNLLRDAKKFDVMMMNRDLIPAPSVTFIEPWLAKNNHRLIFDFDDAIHLGTRERKLRKVLPLFAWLTPGNEYLATFAREVNPRVSIWPTVVDTNYYYPVQERKPGPIRIGWSGSRSSMQHCLPLLETIMTELAQMEDFEFLVIADVPPSLDWAGVKWRYIPWTPQTEVEGLQEIDIGLMPLKDEPFERGKCGLKAIQYLGVGVPSLVSPVGVNKDIVLHGETGFHCSSDNEWINYLRLVMHDENLRRRMGETGRDRVEKNYSIKYLLPQMVDVFEKVSKL